MCKVVVIILAVIVGALYLDSLQHPPFSSFSDDWENVSGTVRCRPSSFHQPSSELEISRIISNATKSGVKVRVVGSGHSFVPIHCEDGVALVNLDLHEGLVSLDEHNLEATFLAGTRTGDLQEILASKGYVLPTQTTINYPSIAGAISTASHGSWREGGSVAGLVTRLRLVKADGSVVVTSMDDDP